MGEPVLQASIPIEMTQDSFIAAEIVEALAARESAGWDSPDRSALAFHFGYNVDYFSDRASPNQPKTFRAFMVHLRRLQAEGLIAYSPGSPARSVVFLTDKGRAHAAEPLS